MRLPGRVRAAHVGLIHRPHGGEVDVAPFGWRAGGKVADLAPQLSERLTALLGSPGVADQLARGQANER